MSICSVNWQGDTTLREANHDEILWIPKSHSGHASISRRYSLWMILDSMHVEYIYIWKNPYMKSIIIHQYLQWIEALVWIDVDMSFLGTRKLPHTVSSRLVKKCWTRLLLWEYICCTCFRVIYNWFTNQFIKIFRIFPPECEMLRLHIVRPQALSASTSGATFVFWLIMCKDHTSQIKRAVSGHSCLFDEKLFFRE